MEPLEQMSLVAGGGGGVGDQSVSEEERQEYLKQLPEWVVTSETDVPHLVRAFPFPDFASALNFTNRVGALAEQVGHHPALLTEWGRVTVSWWTHSIGGLHRNDFILAAKTDTLYKERG